MAQTGHRIPQHEIDALRARADLVRLVENAGVALKKRGANEWWGCCPVHDERTPSFKVDLVRQRARCFGCGISWDAIEVLQNLYGKTFLEAIEHLGGKTEITPAEIQRNQEQRERRERQQQEAAREKTWIAKQIWDEARAHDAAPVRAYLWSRGYDGPVPASLRFHPSPALDRWEPDGRQWDKSGRQYGAMVAGVSLPGQPVHAIHLTYLDRETFAKASIDKAKVMFGPIGGGSVLLGSPGDPFQHLCEGIETGMTVKQRLGLAGVRACLSTSGLINVEVPRSPLDGVIWADRDRVDPKTGMRPGEHAAEKAVERLNGDGFRFGIAVPPVVPGGKADFNDIWGGVDDQH